MRNVLFLMPLLFAMVSCGNPAPKSVAERKERADGVVNSLDPKSAPKQDGVAIMVVMDVSGSMNGNVKGINGQDIAKIKVARKCLIMLAQKADLYAKGHPDKKILFGICAFSSGTNEVLQLAPPDVKKAMSAANALAAGGGTAIGDAMIFAKKKLNESGVKKTHMMIITDGENGGGEDPSVVVAAIQRLPYERQTSTYLVGFDIGNDVFSAVKDAGSMVLSTQNELELANVTGYLLSNKILVEAQE